MLRKIGYSLLWSSSVFSASAMAMTSTLPQPGASIEYKLPANQPLKVGNPYFFSSLTATCSISTADAKNVILVKMLKQWGKVNNEDLFEKEPAKKVTVHSGDKLVIEAAARAEVEITNQGPSEIIASCSIASS